MAATDLIELPAKETALDVFKTPKGLDPYIDLVRKAAAEETPDVTTRKGRDAIASMAFKVRKVKTALDGIGKDLVDDLKDIPKKIDAERKRMREELDALADDVRAPLTAWETAEEQRIARHQAGVDWFRQRASGVRDLDVIELRATIATIEAKAVDATWEEFENEARNARADALTALGAALVAREKHDAEQAELARLRAEAAERERKDAEERIAREAADRARREAEEQAAAERDAAAKRAAAAEAAAETARLNAELAEQRRVAAEKQAELDRQAAAERERLAAEQAERDRVAAAEQAAAAERQRIADEQAAEAAAARAREADMEHRKTINRAALDALTSAGIPEEHAKKVIVLIASGRVPAVSITY